MILLSKSLNEEWDIFVHDQLSKKLCNESGKWKNQVLGFDVGAMIIENFKNKVEDVFFM